jgi:hypothetical protein
MKHFLVFIISIFVVGSISAQNFDTPSLPSLKIETTNGENHISWVSDYSGLKSVQVLRSSDSVLSFVSIGNISKPRKGVQQFVDRQPKLGKNYYKVRVLFASELEWFSNTYKVVLDSATIAASRGRSLTTGSTKSKAGGGSADDSYTDFYYEPSSHIYSNPYTGHIMITLDDVRQKRYSLKFYDPNKEEVLYISRIKKTKIVVDKYNFNARGTYSFKLFESDKIFETGYITIY